MDLIFSFFLWPIAHSKRQFLYLCFLKCPLDQYATADSILVSLADLLRNCTKRVNDSTWGGMTDKELDATFILGSGIIWKIHRLAAVLTISQFSDHNRHTSLKEVLVCNIRKNRDSFSIAWQEIPTETLEWSLTDKWEQKRNNYFIIKTMSGMLSSTSSIRRVVRIRPKEDQRGKKIHFSGINHNSSLWMQNLSRLLNKRFSCFAYFQVPTPLIYWSITYIKF